MVRRAAVATFGARRLAACIGIGVALIASALTWSIGAGNAAGAGAGSLTLSAGGDVTCARLVDGAVRCWGNKKWGQLGNAGAAVPPQPVTVKGISSATAISVGSRTSCALLVDRSVKCWGFRFATRSFGSSAVDVPGFANTIALSVGQSFACAVRAGGTIRCAGYNASGELGHGDTAKHATPVGVRGINNATAISAGVNHACALLADKTVECWGKNSSGELGNGRDSKPVLVPVPVRGVTDALGISAGNGHTCALLANRTVKCWGNNTTGQLGTGSVSSYSLDPVSVGGLIAVRSVSAGGGYTCVVLISGAADCWGYNVFGLLGNGTQNDSSTPVAVRGVANAIGISAGLTHACVARADNSARCWGRNGYGELGDRTHKNSAVPVAVVYLGSL